MNIIRLKLIDHLSSNLCLLLLILFAWGICRARQEPIHIVCVGDSIVADYPMEKARQGWGQAIRQKFTDVQMHNLAVGGRSSKSFIDEGLWAKALEVVDQTKAKYVFIEFGHNDNPGKGPQRETDPSPEGDFRLNMARYVDETRGHGAIPILVTAPPRRWWDWGDTLREDRNLPYAQAMIAVGKEKKCTVVDLNSKVTTLFTDLGQAGTDYLTGTEANWQKDNTHFSQTGALIVAKMIVDDLAKKEPGFAGHLNPDGGPGKIGPAGLPKPANEEKDVLTNAGISWTPGKNALGHAIYFGTSNPPDFFGHLTSGKTATFSPSKLEMGSTYYWRVDAINQGGIAAGKVWNFTVSETPPAEFIEEITLLPEDDSRLFAGDRDENYGNWGSFWGRDYGDGQLMNTGIIQFKLPDGKRELSRVKLELCNKRPQDNKMLRVFALADKTEGEDIDEDVITYNNAPGIDREKAMLSSDTLELISMSGATSEMHCIEPDEIETDALLKFIKQDTNGIITLYLVSSSGAMEFYTKDGGASDKQQPKLRLWYISQNNVTADSNK